MSEQPQDGGGAPQPPAPMLPGMTPEPGQPSNAVDYLLDSVTSTHGAVQGPRTLQQMLNPLGPAAVGGGKYEVDTDQAPQAIADLRHLAAKLRDKISAARQLGKIDPPGLDAVSREAVRVIGEAAVGDYGSLRLALESGAKEAERQADQLEADLKAYLHVEEVNIPQPRPLELP